jgi:hypothetical protein
MSSCDSFEPRKELLEPRVVAEDVVVGIVFDPVAVPPAPRNRTLEDPRSANRMTSDASRWSGRTSEAEPASRASDEIVRTEYRLTHVAFSRLLEWLDDGVDSHGERYLEIRRRLVAYFDRRNRLSADDLADETLNRIGRTLENDGAIATMPPAHYCYVVARFVLREDVRRENMHRGHC